MNRKIYKLNPDLEKYNTVDDNSAKPFYGLQQYVNKSRVQKALDKREQLHKEYLRIYRKPSIWWVVIFHYGFIALILLLKKLGF